MVFIISTFSDIPESKQVFRNAELNLIYNIHGRDTDVAGDMVRSHLWHVSLGTASSLLV
jgi:hypothetical protein